MCVCMCICVLLCRIYLYHHSPPSYQPERPNHWIPFVVGLNPPSMLVSSDHRHCKSVSPSRSQQFRYCISQVARVEIHVAACLNFCTTRRVCKKIPTLIPYPTLLHTNYVNNPQASPTLQHHQPASLAYNRTHIRIYLTSRYHSPSTNIFPQTPHPTHTHLSIQPTATQRSRTHATNKK